MIECIPNFSEGRRLDVVQKLVSAMTQTPEVRVLDWSADIDHNRSVITCVGTPDGLSKGLQACFQVALEHMPMEAHQGQHPRLGSVDVIPFVPLAGSTMAHCVELAHRVGAELADRFSVPVYYYEEAALRPERRNLADVRAGNYEGLKSSIDQPERRPDAGPTKLHPVLGAVAVGARPPLIAYNILLGTSQINVARAVAKRVRARDGGLASVKAMAVAPSARPAVQVSMNLVDFNRSAMYTVFEMVRMEARRYGVPVVGSEVVGLVPLEALVEVARYYLRLEGFKTSQVLESHLLGEWL
ncbi:MAG TPA: glutamate formimidoyltransferase [Candidatus Xenobia bacterium]